MREIVGYVFGFAMVLNAVLFVPQALHLWRTKTAQGVSVVSFAGFNTLQAIGALHGYFERDFALMIGMLASLLTCGSVTVLAACYGRNSRSLSPTALPATASTAPRPTSSPPPPRGTSRSSH